MFTHAFQLPIFHFLPLLTQPRRHCAILFSRLLFADIPSVSSFPGKLKLVCNNTMMTYIFLHTREYYACTPLYEFGAAFHTIIQIFINRDYFDLLRVSDIIGGIIASRSLLLHDAIYQRGFWPRYAQMNNI